MYVFLFIQRNTMYSVQRIRGGKKSKFSNKYDKNVSLAVKHCTSFKNGGPTLAPVTSAPVIISAIVRMRVIMSFVLFF